MNERAGKESHTPLLGRGLSLLLLGRRSCEATPPSLPTIGLLVTARSRSPRQGERGTSRRATQRPGRERRRTQTIDVAGARGAPVPLRLPPFLTRAAPARSHPNHGVHQPRHGHHPLPHRPVPQVPARGRGRERGAGRHWRRRHRRVRAGPVSFGGRRARRRLCLYCRVLCAWSSSDLAAGQGREEQAERGRRASLSLSIPRALTRAPSQPPSSLSPSPQRRRPPPGRRPERARLARRPRAGRHLHLHLHGRPAPGRRDLPGRRARGRGRDQESHGRAGGLTRPGRPGLLL